MILTKNKKTTTTMEHLNFKELHTHLETVSHWLEMQEIDEPSRLILSIFLDLKF